MGHRITANLVIILTKPEFASDSVQLIDRPGQGSPNFGPLAVEQPTLGGISRQILLLDRL